MKNRKLLDEAIKALKTDAEFRRGLAAEIGLLFSESNPADQEILVKTLRVAMPEELKRRIRPGALCESCSERY